MKITVLQHTPKPELLIAKCASTCYDSAPKELKAARKMIKALIKSGHESCIEHASVTFELDEISRVVTHELVRHRLASYSQRSQRYVNEDKPQYIVPDELKGNPHAEGIYYKAMDEAWKYYKELQ